MTYLEKQGTSSSPGVSASSGARSTGAPTGHLRASDGSGTGSPVQDPAPFLVTGLMRARKGGVISDHPHNYGSQH
jgi:hypothetical protein